MLDEQTPRVAVVVPTRNRVEHLGPLLTALRAQTLAPSEFEVVVVDDGSQDETDVMLAEAAGRGDLRLCLPGDGRHRGPARARNRGWRASTAPVVAFTDDDCVPVPGWLEAGLAAMLEAEVVQGPILPPPEEESALGVFTRAVRVTGVTPYFQTGNIFYARAVLEAVGGFDEVEFGFGGEDTDLGWRARETGARSAFAPAAIVHHAVHRLSLLGRLRLAARWGPIVRAYARHPELRRADLDRGIFWKGHYLLVRFLIASLLPRRRRFLRRWLAWPYLRQLDRRRRLERVHRHQLPLVVLCDVIELAAIARAAIRHRTPML